MPAGGACVTACTVALLPPAYLPFEGTAAELQAADVYAVPTRRLSDHVLGLRDPALPQLPAAARKVLQAVGQAGVRGMLQSQLRKAAGGLDPKALFYQLRCARGAAAPRWLLRGLLRLQCACLRCSSGRVPAAGHCAEADREWWRR